MGKRLVFHEGTWLQPKTSSDGDFAAPSKYCPLSEFDRFFSPGSLLHSFSFEEVRISENPNPNLVFLIFPHRFPLFFPPTATRRPFSPPVKEAWPSCHRPQEDMEKQRQSLLSERRLERGDRNLQNLNEKVEAVGLEKGGMWMM